MRKEIQYKEFKVLEVELSESNLIEASAGTGKTYSIAILVLRLLLEKDIPIGEILMVTFTRAAVAELEDRIRKFVRNANRYANGEEIEDEQIRRVVDRSLATLGDEKVKELLKSAVVNLDETAVMTIHGFCQQSLNEFAFETRQLFDVELVSDVSQIVEEEINQFWRTHITGIIPELLDCIVGADFNREGIANILKDHLDGKGYLYYDPQEVYRFDREKQEEFFKKISGPEEKIESIRTSLIDFIKEYKSLLREECDKNNHARKYLLPCVDAPKKFFEVLIEKKKTQYAKKLDPFIEEKLEEWDEAHEKYNHEVQSCLNYLYAYAIQELVGGVRSHKARMNQMSFDDMIGYMNEALTGRDNPDLERELQQKYKAVFIDEFQDTDRQQYEIFEKAFHGHSILFYIGDPKQSIYGWRKADIHTYFEARKKVDHVFEMNVNYRSTSRLVQALNRFFLPEEGFDTFHFANEAEEIVYHPVRTPEEDGKGDILISEKPCAPIFILKEKNKPKIAAIAADQILEFLTDERHQLYDTGIREYRKIRPSDIGILVRSNIEGDTVKKALSALNIPAVTISDQKILQSDEALELVFILEAILQPSLSGINRAMLAHFIPWSIEDIRQLDEEKMIQEFKKYQERWRWQGIYSTLMGFLADFNIHHHLLSSHTEDGERVITNLYHLMEILYQVESRQNLNAGELINWLKINIQKEDSSEDEWEQRIESDEEAVRIVTIHKSKGLQYNIVFAPYLDFKYQKTNKKNQNKTVSFRNQKGEYVAVKRLQLEEGMTETYKTQEEQENRRLLYVALTRAIYKAVVFSNESGHAKGSTLDFFLDKIKTDDLIEYTKIDEEKKYEKYPTVARRKRQEKKAKRFRLLENNWTRMSYSSLTAQLDWQPKERYDQIEAEYDSFIFRDLTKGAKTGNFLHYLFENLHFSNPESWPFTVDKSVARFVPNKKEVWEDYLLQLLEHVMVTEIPVGETTVTLSELEQKNILHELEFDFPVSLFTPSRLSELLESGILITNSIRGQIEGIMNGFIDVFFRYRGKYYILDWKSNYLGPELEDYSPEGVEEAMAENNYHLQYMIYSYAVQKYLGHRIGNQFDYERDFGGVIYLFVRGMRKGENTGIFFRKPKRNQIGKMKEILNNLA